MVVGGSGYRGMMVRSCGYWGVMVSDWGHRGMVVHIGGMVRGWVYRVVTMMYRVVSMVSMVTMMGVTVVTFFPWVKVNFRNCNGITWYKWIAEKKRKKS